MTRPAGVEWIRNDAPDVRAKAIYLGVPSLGVVSIQWHMHMMGLQNPLNRGVVHGYGTGYEVGMGRNFLVQQAMQWTNDRGDTVSHVFFVDDDCLIPPYALTKLLAHNRPIVSGLYYAKTEGAQPLVLMGPGQGVPDSLPKNAVVECFAHGMGCTLIEMQVFDELLSSGIVQHETLPTGQSVPMFFQTTRDALLPDGTRTVYNETEDVFFLKNAAQLGYTAAVDTGVFCFHYDYKGEQGYPKAAWDQYKATGTFDLPLHEVAA